MPQKTDSPAHYLRPREHPESARFKGQNLGSACYRGAADKYGHLSCHVLS